MSRERPHSVSVAGVIVDDLGRALLIKRRDNGRWEPPGGVLEAGETIPEALEREVLEETGVKIAAPATLTGVYKNMTGLIVSLVFRCQAIDGQPTTGDETSELRWATREEISALADEAYAVRVTDALDGANPPAVRAHDGVRLV
ncbi:NUDIX domain-containing protein [Streptomyces sp. 3MP-14]|uniref:NUDIX domain-containing protein n=1 Tax=Streptomyces mimosae TaxID=2586635 RepID=A0A5N5ZZY0_9ACTN|nr:MULTISPECIES: NUDIX hydrolase [Streptomyces]KAB8161825.1 NUDIX domain-containing protein [Streptomyces mimosae]KAB8174907.1 NUDIX domain-containing protein [Streptomyces sp. 3MP-14]